MTANNFFTIPIKNDTDLRCPNCNSLFVGHFPLFVVNGVVCTVCNVCKTNTKVVIDVED